MMTLRNLPNFDELFAGELGAARAGDMAMLLDQFWPDCFESPSSGQVVMRPEDAQRLEALFELFGVPLRVSEHSIDTLGYAYDIFVQRLARYVTYRLTLPKTFNALTSDWPYDWRAYMEAVALRDSDVAKEYAQKLQPLSPDCILPPGA